MMVLRPIQQGLLASMALSFDNTYTDSIQLSREVVVIGVPDPSPVIGALIHDS